MKTFVFLCVLIVGVTAQNFHLTQEQKEKVQKNKAQCVKESGVSINVLSEAKTGNLSDDEGLKKFFFCFFRIAGIVGPNGELNVDVALKKLPADIDKAKAEKVLNECKTKTGKDASDTAYQIFKCYYSGTNQRVIFE